MTILIVEDNPVSARLLSDLLEGAGYTPLHAIDGYEATLILKSQQVDMIVSDVDLPRLDGFELFKVVKKQYPKTDFILYTSANTPELERLAATMGIKKFFSNSLSNLQSIADSAMERVKRAVEDNSDITKRILKHE